MIRQIREMFRRNWEGPLVVIPFPIEMDVWAGQLRIIWVAMRSTINVESGQHDSYPRPKAC